MDKAEQLFCGIVINEKLEYTGSASIDVDLGEEIKQIFWEAATAQGVDIPEGAIFKCGEIFYHNNRIQEFRLTVTIPAEPDSAAAPKTIGITKNEPESRFEQIKSAAAIADFYADLDRKYTDEKKSFKVIPARPRIRRLIPKDPVINIPTVLGAKLEDIRYVETITAELKPALADRTRKYLAAYIKDNQLYFCWNLPSLENVDNRSEEHKSETTLQPFVLKLLYPILGLIKISLSDLSNSLVISLKTLLSAHIPKRPAYKRQNEVKSERTLLTFCYNNSVIEQSLYNAFEEIIDVPAVAIERIIKKNGCSREHAIQVFFLEVIWARDGFYKQEIFLQYPRFVADMLEFTNWALTDLYARNAALRFSPHATISVKSRNAAINALGKDLQKRTKELFLFTAGRRQGSTNLSLPADESIKEKRLADQIRNAIKIVCQKMIEKHGEIDIEGKVTRIAVAKELKISRKTLGKQILVCGLDFNGERDKLIRHSSRT